MKNITIATVFAFGILSIGAVSAYATDATQTTCQQSETYQQFLQETAVVRSALNAKNQQLRDQEGYGGIERGYGGLDYANIARLEKERDELQAKLDAAARKYGLR